jgi:hypothetical protein
MLHRGSWTLELSKLAEWGSRAVEYRTYGARQHPPSIPQPFRAGLILAAGPTGLDELSGREAKQEIWTSLNGLGQFFFSCLRIACNSWRRFAVVLG